ncbi:unnamed protein product, partial [Mesorhabditis spiculigera]
MSQGNERQEQPPSGHHSEDVIRSKALLADLGVEEYDPKVLDLLNDIAYQTATELLNTARSVSTHCGKSSIEVTDVRIASEFLGYNRADGPTRDQITQIAKHTNEQPLPQIRHSNGLKLPNDRFCLLQNNVRWRMDNPPPAKPAAHLGAGDMPTQFRPEQVNAMLKRKAPADDFD